LRNGKVKAKGLTLALKLLQPGAFRLHLSAECEQSVKFALRTFTLDEQRQ
jgi:hypothetical protein